MMMEHKMKKETQPCLVEKDGRIEITSPTKQSKYIKLKQNLLKLNSTEQYGASAKGTPASFSLYNLIGTAPSEQVDCGDG